MPTANLTDALVKSLKCDTGKNVIELRDTALQGLELRVWASGAGRVPNVVGICGKRFSPAAFSVAF